MNYNKTEKNVDDEIETLLDGTDEIEDETIDQIENEIKQNTERSIRG